MATPEELESRGLLVNLASALEPGRLPLRRMYAFESFVRWYENDLPDIKRDWRGRGAMEPLDQVDEMIERFLTGGPFSTEHRSKNVLPKRFEVWELKSADIRLFGWFWKPDYFIIYRGMDATWVKDSSAYSGLAREAAFHRDALDLDEPKSIAGSYEDVFQV